MKKQLVFVVLAFFSVSCFAQSSEKISEILSAKKATYGHVTYLCAVYMEKVGDDASFEEAFESFRTVGKIENDIFPDNEITLSAASFLLAQATGMKGGLWYTISPSPRYALRELKSRKIVPESQDPKKKLSGRDAVDLFSTCVASFDSN